eukprot:2155229-Rhodomonas_salina.1
MCWFPACPPPIPHPVTTIPVPVAVPESTVWIRGGERTGRGCVCRRAREQERLREEGRRRVGGGWEEGRRRGWRGGDPELGVGAVVAHAERHKAIALHHAVLTALHHHLHTKLLPVALPPHKRLCQHTPRPLTPSPRQAAQPVRFALLGTSMRCYYALPGTALRRSGSRSPCTAPAPACTQCTRAPPVPAPAATPAPTRTGSPAASPPLWPPRAAPSPAPPARAPAPVRPRAGARAAQTAELARGRGTRGSMLRPETGRDTAHHTRTTHTHTHTQGRCWQHLPVQRRRCRPVPQHLPAAPPLRQPQPLHHLHPLPHLSLRPGRGLAYTCPAWPWC